MVARFRYNRRHEKVLLPQKNPKKNKRKHSKPWFWRLFFRLAAIGLVILAGWTVYLDAVVTSRFEGRRFEVPSRVYARPLELYDGASVSAGGCFASLNWQGSGAAMASSLAPSVRAGAVRYQLSWFPLCRWRRAPAPVVIYGVWRPGQ